MFYIIKALLIIVLAVKCFSFSMSCMILSIKIQFINGIKSTLLSEQ